MPRMLVTGAAGMVGSYVETVFADYELLLTDVLGQTTVLDVRNEEAVQQAVAAYRPQVVLHLAAATDVDRCEQDPQWASQLNAMGTVHVATACRKYDALLVYLSTGAVFSGDKATPYGEDDVPQPANTYGRSKLDGERSISALLERYAIVRAGWMIGGGVRDKKFVGKMARLLADGRRSLQVVNDTWGSPTYAKDVLIGVRRLLEANRYGLYHMVNPGCCSRYEVALAVRDLLQRPDVEIVPVSSEAFPLPAPRPRMEALENLRLERLGLHLMRPWRDALRDYLHTELTAAASGVGR